MRDLRRGQRHGGQAVKRAAGPDAMPIETEARRSPEEATLKGER